MDPYNGRWQSWSCVKSVGPFSLCGSLWRRSVPRTRRWPGPDRRGRGSLTRQLQLAANDLTKAYAAANKDFGKDGTVPAARQAARQARHDYGLALAAAKAAIVPSPELVAVRTQVRDLQDRLDAVRDSSDWSVRMAISGDLTTTRARLNALEAEGPGG